MPRVDAATAAKPAARASQDAMQVRHAKELERIERLAGLLDARFRIPFTPIRFGLDGALGLIPGIGDTIALAPSAYIITRAHSLGVPRETLLRMVGNSALDYVIGLVPFLGDLFDIGFKANLRNAALLRSALDERSAR